MPGFSTPSSDDHQRVAGQHEPVHRGVRDPGDRHDPVAAVAVGETIEDEGGALDDLGTRGTRGVHRLHAVVAEPRPVDVDLDDHRAARDRPRHLASAVDQGQPSLVAGLPVPQGRSRP